MNPPDKESIQAECIRRQHALIDALRSRIKTLLEPVGLGNEEAYDNGDLAANAQQMTEVNALNQALEAANEDLMQLENLQSVPTANPSKAGPGALIITNHGTFFVSVASEQFSIGGQSYVGLSVRSPLYQRMHGKGKGEKFSYHGVIYVIEDIL